VEVLLERIEHAGVVSKGAKVRLPATLVVRDSSRLADGQTRR